MKSIKYVLEIYSPENPQEILRSFEATDPFILISCGSILNPSQWTDRYEGQLLRVSKVEHGISEGEGITQTLSELVEEGWMSRDDALKIIDPIMRGNAYDVFNLETKTKHLKTLLSVG